MKADKIPTGSKVHVTWLDHHSLSEKEWKTLEDLEAQDFPDCVCETVGFLVKKDKNKIMIAQNKSDGNDYADLMVIITLCIKKIRKVK